MCRSTPSHSKHRLLCRKPFRFAIHWNPGRYFFLFFLFCFFFFFFPTLLISYSVAGGRLPFCPKCFQKSFVGLPWPKLSKCTYLGGQNACFGGQKCQNLQSNYFVPNATKSHLGVSNYQNVHFLWSKTDQKLKKKNNHNLNFL